MKKNIPNLLNICAASEEAATVALTTNSDPTADPDKTRRAPRKYLLPSQYLGRTHAHAVMGKSQMNEFGFFRRQISLIKLFWKECSAIKAIFHLTPLNKH